MLVLVSYSGRGVVGTRERDGRSSREELGDRHSGTGETASLIRAFILVRVFLSFTEADMQHRPSRQMRRAVAVDRLGGLVAEQSFTSIHEFRGPSLVPNCPRSAREESIKKRRKIVSTSFQFHSQPPPSP